MKIISKIPLLVQRQQFLLYYYLLIIFLLFSLGTVRRFLEIHGETLEKVVFAVSELEEVFC